MGKREACNNLRSSLYLIYYDKIYNKYLPI